MVPVFGSGGSSAKRVFLCFQYSFTGKDGSDFGSWKTVPAVPVPLSVSGKTVPTVPVPGSGSVPEPPWSREISTFFDTDSSRAKTSKGVKNNSRRLSTSFARHKFSGPFLEALESFRTTFATPLKRQRSERLPTNQDKKPPKLTKALRNPGNSMP